MDSKRVLKAKPKPTSVNFILMDGGVGDHMASLVAIDYVVTNYAWIKPLIWVPDYMLDFSRHVLPSKALVRNYSAMQAYYNEKLPTKTTKWDGVMSPMKIHCLDYAFLKLCDENPPIEAKNYLKIRPNAIDTDSFKLSDKYVVITTGYTAKVREFKAKYINEVAAYVKGKGYMPVFLGQTKTETGASHIIEGNFDADINFNIGLNLVNKTTLLEAAKIMGNATAVVGIDNGLLHVAGCTDVAILGGFTTVSPRIRMPVRHNVLGWNYYPIVSGQGKGCNFCQEKTNFLYGHDYRECLYKDDICTEQMTADKFIEYLKEMLV